MSEQLRKTYKLPKRVAMNITRDMFLLGATRKAIAEVVGYTENAVGVWVKKMELDNVSKYKEYSPESIIRGLFQELYEIEKAVKGRPDGQQFANAKEADARRKIIASIKDLKSGLVLQQYVQCAMEMDRFVKQEYPAKTADILKEVLDAFIQQKGREAEAAL